MGLQDEIYAKIKEEIANDPDGVGYAGKTDAEIMTLLNSTIVRQRVIEESYPPPIYRILIGISKAPNIINETDVTDAKK